MKFHTLKPQKHIYIQKKNRLIKQNLNYKKKLVKKLVHEILETKMLDRIQASIPLFLSRTNNTWRIH